MTPQQMRRDTLIAGPSIIVAAYTFLAKPESRIQALRWEIILGNFQKRVRGAGFRAYIEKILDQ